MRARLNMQRGVLAITPALSRRQKQPNSTSWHSPPLPLGEGWGEGKQHTNLPNRLQS
jgi:hypothetical protein